jgi:phenylpropionate dioxygenase-like ring-hydroxylating dioxygenase large terminal subunit
MTAPTHDAIDAVLDVGLKNLWYPICPSGFVAERPVALSRLGYKLVLWREPSGALHALEDRCPHRGAPLSQGILIGNRIACGYHGVQVRGDGVVMSVPGSPGCKLEGARATRSFHLREAAGAIWLYNASETVDEAPPLILPDELTGAEFSSFLSYTEWDVDYRYVLDNVVDPMHGAFLHKQSHSMAEGDMTAEFRIRELEHGFIFEKVAQRDVNFDWTEWADTGIHWSRLEIPYPKTGGPGGNFIIIGSFLPITKGVTAVFFWRVRKLSGWQRDAWRFLYKNRLEERHWKVLEQDRVVMEAMDANANEHEMLYHHDIGIVRLRRHLRKLASAQLAAAAAANTAGTPA